METRFVDVLESVEALSTIDKEMLVDIVRNRLLDARRSELRDDLDESLREFEKGICREMSIDDFMAEVNS